MDCRFLCVKWIQCIIYSEQPQGYFASILLQSNNGFFNLSFTLLCIAHNHWEAAALDEVCGGYWVIIWLKWRALYIHLSGIKKIKLLVYHSPQGYSFEKRNMNSFRDSRSCSVGFSGYLAIIVCKNYCSEWKNPCLIYPSLPSMLLCQALLYWKERCFNNNTLLFS